MIAVVRSFARDERGATAIEYGIIIALIALAIITSLTLVADEVDEMWNLVSGKVSSAT